MSTGYTDPQEREAALTRKLKADPTLVRRLSEDVVTAFVEARRRLQLAVILTDPLGMAGPQKLTPEQEELLKNYEAELSRLEEVMK